MEPYQQIAVMSAMGLLIGIIFLAMLCILFCVAWIATKRKAEEFKELARVRASDILTASELYRRQIGLAMVTEQNIAAHTAAQTECLTRGYDPAKTAEIMRAADAAGMANLSKLLETV